MTKTEIGGRCLCGAVRFTTAAPKEIGLCHCGMCRKWCGGLPAAAFIAKVSLSGGALKWYKSSEWCERGFCGECGSSLFWRAPGMEEWGVLAGAADSTDGAKIVKHIYADDKPAFYDFADDAPRITGARFVAHLFADFRRQFGETFLQDAMQKCRRHHGDSFANEVEKYLAAQNDS